MKEKESSPGPIQWSARVGLIGVFVVVGTCTAIVITMEKAIKAMQRATTFLNQNSLAPQSNKSFYAVVYVKGILHYGVISASGETTGVIVVVDKDNWDLDFGSNEKLFRLAEKLDGKNVLVIGEPKIFKGAAIPARKVILVFSLEEVRGER